MPFYNAIALMGHSPAGKAKDRTYRIYARNVLECWDVAKQMPGVKFILEIKPLLAEGRVLIDIPRKGYMKLHRKKKCRKSSLRPRMASFLLH